MFTGFCIRPLRYKSSQFRSSWARASKDTTPYLILYKEKKKRRKEKKILKVKRKEEKKEEYKKHLAKQITPYPASHLHQGVIIHSSTHILNPSHCGGSKPPQEGVIVGELLQVHLVPLGRVLHSKDEVHHHILLVNLTSTVISTASSK
jgi:hypothetical protein